MTKPMTTREERLLTPDPREGKLPQWAQEKLRRTRAMTEDARKTAKEAVQATRPEESAIVLNPYQEHGGIGIADERSTLRFWLSKDAYVDIQTRNGRLVLHGSDPLVMFATASNSFRVGVERWSERP